MNTFTATESYLSLLLSLPHLKPMTVLAIMFLTLGRLLPIVSLAPFFGAPKTVPGAIRMLFSLSLLALFLPQNLMVAQGEIPFITFSFLGFFLKELVIGFILGFVAAAPFLFAQMGGSLIDFQRGASSLQVTDPTTMTQTGPLGIVCNMVLVALFFSFSGPFLYLKGVADSYRLIPVDGVISATVMNAHNPFWRAIIQLAAMMMRIAAQLAAPALIGILLTDLFLGIANRLAPQVQIVFLGIALKSWVGLALMAAAWTMMVRVMLKETMGWFHALNWLIAEIGQAYGKHS